MINVKVRCKNKTYVFVLNISELYFMRILPMNRIFNQYYTMLLLRYQIKMVVECKIFHNLCIALRRFLFKNISNLPSILHTIATEYHTFVVCLTIGA
jgi:hypothetical protein